MERLTYDFALGGNHCWQVKGADNLECREVCERQGDDGCKTCPISKAFDRLAAIEDILGDEYDLARLRELALADREGRCLVLPCKVGDTVYFSAWFGTDPHIVKRIIAPYFYTDDARGCGSSADFYLKDFGETVFLTRAEAEAALRREQE